MALKQRGWLVAERAATVPAGRRALDHDPVGVGAEAQSLTGVATLAAAPAAGGARRARGAVLGGRAMGVAAMLPEALLEVGDLAGEGGEGLLQGGHLLLQAEDKLDHGGRPLGVDGFNLGGHQERH